MALTDITGKVLDGTGAAIANEYVYFTLKQVGVDDDVTPEETFLNRTVEGLTNSSGELKASDGTSTLQLWVNGDSDVTSVYEIRYPTGATYEVIIPTSTSTIDIATLVALHQVSGSSQQAVIADRTTHTGGPDDLNGNEIILDVDGDTSITADTDDQIDFKIGGTDQLSLTATRAANLEALSDLDSGTRDALGFYLQNAIFVSKNGTDTRTGLDPHDIGNPFLTVNAAEDAASSGDIIIVFPGSYSGESDLSGADGVYYYGLDGAVLPTFNISTAITIYGRGECISVTCNNASATVKFKDMVATLGITCSAGNLEIGRVQSRIICSGGTTTTKDFTQSYSGGLFGAPIQLSSTAVLKVYNARIETTGSGEEVVDIANSWSGTLFMSNCDLVATTVSTNEATTGILYGTSVTGDVQLKNVTIITAQNGTGVAKSIDAPSAQTVYVQGSVNQTHAEDGDITYRDGLTNTNTNYTA